MMPLQCPRCEFVQTYGNLTCVNCGEPLFSADQIPATAVQFPSVIEPRQEEKPRPAAALERHDSWNWPAFLMGVLFCVLVTAALFLAYRAWQAATSSFPSSGLNAPQVNLSPPSASLPTISQVAGSPLAASAASPKSGNERAPAKPAAAEPRPPLIVSLTFTPSGRRVRVGTPLTVTVLAPDRNAAITLFYQRDQGRKITLAFAQGSLFSTAWTPTAPGHYDFRVSALVGRQVTLSRRQAVNVEPPLEKTTGKIASDAAPDLAPVLHSAAARDTGPVRYHVAAARFFAARSAEVLADALRRRGLPAASKPAADNTGRRVYVVETGAYAHEAEARKAALALLRDGYPAYSFKGH